MSRGSSSIRAIILSSSREPRSMPILRNEGLFHEKMSAGERPPMRARSSASEKGSWKKSLSSISRPACESAALALRQELHLFHQYSRASSGATSASLVRMRPECPDRVAQQEKLSRPSAAIHDGHGGLQMRPARGQHRQVASPLDGSRQLPLMLGADTRLPPRLYLGLVGNVPDQHVHVLVVDVGDVVGAEAAYLAPGVIPAPATASARPTPGRTSGA